MMSGLGKPIPFIWRMQNHIRVTTFVVIRSKFRQKINTTIGAEFELLQFRLGFAAVDSHDKQHLPFSNHQLEKAFKK